MNKEPKDLEMSVKEQIPTQSMRLGLSVIWVVILIVSLIIFG